MRNMNLIFSLILCGFIARVSVSFAAVQGPYGGSATDIQLGPDGNTPEAISTTNGLFRFEDGAWSRVEALGQRNFRNILGISDRVLLIEQNQGLLAGANWRADSWNPISSGLKGRYGTRADDLYKLAIADDMKTLYLGSAGQGPFVSKDGGLTWTQLLAGIEDEPPPAYHVFDILPPEGSRPLVMGTDGAGLFSFVEGKWKKTGAGLPERTRVWALASQGGNSMILALATRANGLWKSVDGGDSWTRLRKGAYGVVEALSFGKDGDLLAHFPEEGLFVFHDDKVEGPLGLADAKVNALVARAKGGWWAALDHDGLMEISVEGRPGVFFNNGLDASRVRSLIQGKDGSIWAGDSNGVFYSPDSGKTWEARDEGLFGAAVNNFLWHKGELYLGSAGQGVYQWMPDKKEWAPRINGLGTANTIFTFVADADGEKLYVGTEGGILRRDGEEEKWVRKNGDLPIYSVWIVEASRINAGKLWAAGGKSLFVSEDAGENWKEMQKIQVAALSVDKSKSKDRLWVANKNAVFFLEDEDPSKKNTVEIALARGERIQCLLSVEETVWVGTSKGLWRINDGLKGESIWTGASVQSLLFDKGQLYGGTEGTGVVRFEL